MKGGEHAEENDNNIKGGKEAWEAPARSVGAAIQRRRQNIDRDRETPESEPHNCLLLDAKAGDGAQAVYVAG